MTNREQGWVDGQGGWTRASLGSTPELGEVLSYTKTLDDGSSVTLSGLGARILSLRVPDREGRIEEVTQTFGSLEAWLGVGRNHGAICGRYANRIAGSSFVLNGERHSLYANEGANSLHGGERGFNLRNWTASVEGEALAFRYRSADGEEGYPGALDCCVRYRFDDAHTLTLDYEATTDRDTVVNLTNHVYFNIAGPAAESILEQQLRVAADFVTEVDRELIPTGAILPVTDGPFDFTEAKAIGRDIEADDVQLGYGGGYDHNFVLRQSERGALGEAARLYDPASGRRLICSTTLPGLQIYTTNKPHQGEGADGRRYGRFSGICLETQYFPDSLAHSWFPSPVLRAGDLWRHTTSFAFDCAEAIDG